MQLPVVSLDDWIGLEDALAVRYPKAKWRAQQVLKGLLRFPYWKVPTSDESWEQTGGLSRATLQRRRLEAAAELDLMATLPPLTTGLELALLEQKVAFGVVPASTIIRQQDRQLTLFHVWALADRRRTADLVCESMGGRWLVPLAVLEEELERRQDEEAVELIKLHQERRRERESKAVSGGGPQCIAITF